MKYYIIAGEASGDLHGGNLIRGLIDSDPQAEFRFWGGEKMAAAVAERGKMVHHYKETAIMGYIEVLKNIRKISGFMRECREDIRAYYPDVVIFIDYPGFNLRMAKFAKSIGIPTHYYIAPKVWAWKEKRVKRIRQYVDKLFIIFPFEIEYFRKHGIEAFYAGNPIMDSIADSSTSESSVEFRRDNGLDNRPIVALVAGSRKGEIHFNLPNMVAVSKAFPDYQFVVTGVSWLDKALYDKVLSGSGVRYVCDKTYETIAHSAAALVTSGTATLETALLNVPEVVCFKGSWVTISIAKMLVKLPYVSLVNIVMGRHVVTELIQEKFTVDAAISQLRDVLPGGARHEAMKADFVKLAQAIGTPGASQRVAKEIVRILKTK